MPILSRRRFLRASGAGLALAGGSELILPADAQPTASSGNLGAYATYLQEKPPQAGGGKRPANWALTEDNILGPFHRRGAPFRAKITPPLEPGTVLVIKGRVWGHDTRKPLPNAVIDIWQANARGRYDNDDPKNPPAASIFVNRARVITDENGAYEYETIHPGAYRIGPETWRPPHIHYWIRATGYRELITQLYFRGDPHQKGDNWIKDSLIIDLREHKQANGVYKSGAFDIILAPARRP
jgi:catechol 1,2-dioxygenase